MAKLTLIVSQAARTAETDTPLMPIKSATTVETDRRSFLLKYVIGQRPGSPIAARTVRLVKETIRLLMENARFVVMGPYKHRKNFAISLEIPTADLIAPVVRILTHF